MPDVLPIGTIIVAALTVVAVSGFAAEVSQPVGRFEFVVRSTTAGEVPTDTSKEWLEMTAPSLGYGALGVIAAPMVFSTAMIVGGLILAPTTLIMSAIERSQWEGAVNALTSTDFPRQVERAVRGRARNAFPDRAGPVATVDVTLNAYGLSDQGKQRACFISDASLVVRVEGAELMQRRLRISNEEATTGAPPPYCASLEKFAQAGGQLVRDTAAEYAEILAVMIMDQIAAGIKP